MNPNNLKQILLSDASSEAQKEFAKMLAEQCAEADLKAKGHVCWLEIPNADEYAIMAKYAQQRVPGSPDGNPKYTEQPPCPKCGKGRVVLTIRHDNLGQNLWLKCQFGEPNCDFKEYSSVYDLDMV